MIKEEDIRRERREILRKNKERRRGRERERSEEKREGERERWRERETADDPGEGAGRNDSFDEIFVNDHSQKHFVGMSAEERREERMKDGDAWKYWM